MKTATDLIEHFPGLAVRRIVDAVAGDLRVPAVWP